MQVISALHESYIGLKDTRQNRSDLSQSTRLIVVAAAAAVVAAAVGRC